MLGFLFKDKKLNNVAHTLFAQVIDQSRLPIFYLDYAVEDTLDGRFDLMALHMSLLINKLDQNESEPKVPELKRMLQEAMFDNLDLTMREVGVGDLGVGKKVKVMAEAFYGRVKVYQEIIDRNNSQEMREAIQRNLYRERTIKGLILENITMYYFNQWQNITEQRLTDLMQAKIKFIEPQGFTSDE